MGMSSIRSLAFVLALGCPVSSVTAGCEKKAKREEDTAEAGVRQESEDRESPATAALKDLDAAFEARVNAILDGARKAHPTDRGAMLDAAFVDLGAKVKGSGYGVIDIVKLSAIEVWLEKTYKDDPARMARLTWKESRYGANKPGAFNWKTPTLMSEGGANHAIVPTIRLRGVLVGIDKWAHYFNTGWLYFKDDLLRSDRKLRDGVSRWLEGDCHISKEERDLYAPHARRIGYAMFGFLGSWSTGVISRADMYANEQGFQFWDALAKDPKGYRFTTASLEMNKLNEVRNPSLFIKGLIVDAGEGQGAPEHCP